MDGPIPSPTFNLLLRYAVPYGREVVHVDLFRIRRPEELRELGWGDLGAPGEIVLVEWPERAGERLPLDRWDVVLGYVRGDTSERTVQVTRVGAACPLPELPVGAAADGLDRS